MNRYPMWWNSSITVYTKYEDAVTNIVTWYKNTIDGCFWKYTGNKTTIGNTVLDTNTITCRIPKQDNFIDKGTWIGLTNDKLKDYFTLGQGDIIVKGIVSDEINEYSKGHYSSDLIAKYKKFGECMVVSRYSDNTGGGRNEEHYSVQGE